MKTVVKRIARGTLPSRKPAATVAPRKIDAALAPEPAAEPKRARKRSWRPSFSSAHAA